MILKTGEGQEHLIIVYYNSFDGCVQRSREVKKATFSPFGIFKPLNVNEVSSSYPV